MTAAEWIARRREIEQPATPGVWVAYHGGDTAKIWGACPSFPCPEGCIDPMGHPDVLSMDETPRGDVEASWLPDAADLKFIADARTSLPRALDALETVAELHQLVPGWDDCSDGCCGDMPDTCSECYHDWPCPTVTAITTALEADPR